MASPQSLASACTSEALRRAMETCKLSGPTTVHAHAHALLIPYPSQGHINPLMQLGRSLASMGVMTTLVTIEHFVARMAKANNPDSASCCNNSRKEGDAIKEFSVQGEDGGVLMRVVGVPDGLPPESEREGLGQDLGFAVENFLEGAVVELVHTLSDCGRPVTCLIGDFFLSWMPHLAQVVNLPEVVFWPQNASAFAIYSHLDHIISSGYNPFKSNARAFGPKEPMDLVTCIPGLSPVHPSDLPFETTVGEVGLTWLEKLFTIRFTNLHKAAGVLGNCFNELERDVCKALGSKFHAIGPLVPYPSETDHQPPKGGSNLSLWEEDECTQWLDMQPPKSVVYVSFGSLAKRSIAQIQELAEGLAASNQRFLWVIRKNGVWEKVGNVVEEALPKGFLEEVKGRGKIINWAPQARVLSHPSVGGFFSHCGWNSSLESLTFGVPVLGWPFMMDQTTNCWLLCNEWKVGLKVETSHDNQVGRAGVERAVRLLMEGEEAHSMRGRVAKLKDAAQRAHLSTIGGSSHENLKLFVNQTLAPN